MRYLELLYNDLVRCAVEEIGRDRFTREHPIEQALCLLEATVAQHQMVFRTTGNNYFRLMAVGVPKEQPTLILVGCTPAMCAFLTFLLVQAGYQVLRADDPYEVIILCERWVPALIIYDLDRMTLNSIDQCIMHIPQLAMSATEAGGIRKPFTTDTLLTCVKLTLREE